MFRILVFTATLLLACVGPAPAETPTPLVEHGQPADWLFVFKFNAKSFSGCGGASGIQRVCPFGGTVQPYSLFGQQFVYASSNDPSLQKGSGCLGETVTDPLGATFDKIYNQSYFYVVWNDQFYDSPKIHGCTKFCGPCAYRHEGNTSFRR